MLIDIIVNKLYNYLNRIFVYICFLLINLIINLVKVIYILIFSFCLQVKVLVMNKYGQEFWVIEFFINEFLVELIDWLNFENVFNWIILNLINIFVDMGEEIFYIYFCL